MSTFKDLALRAELIQAVQDLGFDTPTPIQQKLIPVLLEQPSDIVGLAQTGTGKTAAFGLPLLHYTDENTKHIQGLVLSPTRELCMQIQEDLKRYSAHIPGLRVTAVYGGVPISGQIRELKAHPQVVVATPGRLIDLLERKAIHLEDVNYVVLDEADEMLNMGFRDDIDFILQSTPNRNNTWLFSATMNKEVRNIASRFMSDWKEYSVARANSTNENIDHQYYVIRHHHRFKALQRLLDYTPGIYGIIFTRTKQDAQDIAEKLMKQGYQVSPLHGDMDQKMRSKVMERFKSKTIQLIVATDVAARGIDVNDISHVINYELPDDPEVYTHRSGRTARAGKSGICMSLVSPKEIGNIRQIERVNKSTFHRGDIPDGSEVVRKNLFFHINHIETEQPADGFAEIYKDIIHERFAAMDKDELIKKLIWLQLKETMQKYEDAEDINAGYEKIERSESPSAGGASSGGNKKWTRMFINVGSKDGFNEESLTQFIHDMTEVEKQLIERVVVKELSSFYNIRTDALDYVEQILNTRKIKSRKVRTEAADKGPSFKKGGERVAKRRTERPKAQEFSQGSDYFNRKNKKKY